MANGKIRFGKQSGITITEVIVPESGILTISNNGFAQSEEVKIDFRVIN